MMTRITLRQTLPTTQEFTVPVPEDFEFWLSVYSTGWSVLEPFSIDEENRILYRVHRLESGEAVRITSSQEEKGRVEVRLESLVELDGGGVKELEDMLRSCLGVEDDFTAFYETLGDYPGLAWAVEIGAGRSLRCPTVFEDTVKTIATTNASWGLTRGIVRRLCEKLGDAHQDSHTFPTPDQIAGTTEEFLRAEVKSGYRSPYLVELAQRIVGDDLDVEAWRGSPLDSAALKKEIKGVKGVGDYAADNILKLLGRYDFLALDSWMRKKFSEIHGGGKPVPDEVIEEHYEPFGEWKGLALALEMTKEWLVAKKDT